MYFTLYDAGDAFLVAHDFFRRHALTRRRTGWPHSRRALSARVGLDRADHVCRMDDGRVDTGHCVRSVGRIHAVSAAAGQTGAPSPNSIITCQYALVPVRPCILHSR